MHYHPVPQMPGDDLLTLCNDHALGASDDPVYLCDCDRNQCGPCEENWRYHAYPTGTSMGYAIVDYGLEGENGVTIEHIVDPEQAKKRIRELNGL